jgi:ABC-2 type transport system permease protein
MKTMLKLARTVFRGNGVGILADNAGRRWRKLSRIGSILLLIILAGYMAVMAGGTTLYFYDALLPLSMQHLIVGLFLNSGWLLAFFFGILHVISVFYYSSDVEKLLPLPLKAEQIIGAKLLVVAAYELIYLTILIAPPLVVFGVRSAAGIQYYFYMLIVLIMLPVIPICVAALLSMVIMRFTTLARNKDRFSLVSGLLVLLVALAVTYGGQSMTALPADDLAERIGQRVGSLVGTGTIIFPGVTQAVGALTESAGPAAVGQIALLIFISAVILALTLGLSKVLYFKGVIGLGSSGYRRKKMAREEMIKATGSGSAFAAYMLKDLRILLRTPIFFMNNVIMNFIWPIFVLIPFLQGGQDPEFVAFLTMLRSTLVPDSPTVPIALAAAFAAACFISGTNGVSSSALSREGKLFYFVKILPMSYHRQIWAKLLLGMALSLIGIFLLVVMLILLIGPPVWFLTLLIAIIPGAVLLTNIPGMLFELLWPKLKWDNEQKAVKQNLNVLYGILVGILLAALAIITVVAFALPLLPTILILCIVPLLLALGLTLLIRRIGPRLIDSLDV